MSDKYEKQILCLANSRKPFGRCVAGKEKSGVWIRPVSARPGGELSTQDRQFGDGGDPQVGDILYVPLLGSQTHAYQVENHLINGSDRWRFQRKATWEEVISVLDQVSGDLWGTGSSSYYGLNDRVTLNEAANLGESLKLILVEDLVIISHIEGGSLYPAKRRIRGNFSVNSFEYRLSITDPGLENTYSSGVDGEFNVGKAALCISLSEPLDGVAYKLIAGMILPF